ncbi:MAG: hypothetical protein MO846_09400 [Candidatus Devosia symbiotica]|nr:hypothetical protein [Candidatus Devosia symbiotica]
MSAALAVGDGLVGLLLANLLAAVCYAEVPVLQRITVGYVDFICNTPLIMQLFFVAFELPRLFGYSWPFWGACATSADSEFFSLFC